MNPTLKTLYIDTPTTYDGTQLRSHWIYEQTGVLGNALVAFTGPADVKLDHMVDLEDVRQKAPIYSPLMLHFLGEWFDDSLEKAILYQHFFAANVYELLWEKGVKGLRRRGNDIYCTEKKLSVSIATRSPVSLLVHVGLNIQTENTPVPTAGLSELGIQTETFGKECLDRFENDFTIWAKARVKVRPR